MPLLANTPLQNSAKASGSCCRPIFQNCRLLLLLIVSLQAICAQAETLTIAVASNFAHPMREIAGAFERSTEHSIRLAFGSSGKLTAQILQGAPFQVFFSADDSKPRLLLERGVATPGSQFTYAYGGLALWSRSADVNTLTILQAGNFNKLALANPKLAPYGAAAIEVLEGLGLIGQTRKKWVQGENIAQTYQFVDSGNAEIGFIALSQITQNDKAIQGSAWRIPASFHTPIRQDAVLLGADPGQTARQFTAFVRGPVAHNIIERYGYRIEVLRAEAEE